MRIFKFYMEEVSNDGSEFVLVLEIDGKVKDIKTESPYIRSYIDRLL